jgi:hypothetical protein
MQGEGSHHHQVRASVAVRSTTFLTLANFNKRPAYYQQFLIALISAIFANRQKCFHELHRQDTVDSNTLLFQAALTISH